MSGIVVKFKVDLQSSLNRIPKEFSRCPSYLILTRLRAVIWKVEFAVMFDSGVVLNNIPLWFPFDLTRCGNIFLYTSESAN